MTRAAVLLDRIAVLVLGLVLVAAGLATAGWAAGRFGVGYLSFSPALTASASSWWPWACGAVGALLVLVGVRWLAAHGRAPRVVNVNLAHDDGGAVSADPGAVADAAATLLAAEPGVLKASARAAWERGVATVTLSVTVSGRHGLAFGAQTADKIALTVSQMLDERVAVRARIRVDRKRGHRPVL